MEFSKIRGAAVGGANNRGLPYFWSLGDCHIGYRAWGLRLSPISSFKKLFRFKSRGNSWI